MSDTPHLSVVLPCYNESGNIPLIYQRFREVLQGRTDVEVLLVNNGSTDDSAAVFSAQQALPENAFARVVTVVENKGYGFGILSGLREGRGEVLGWTHADMQTDPEDVLKALDAWKKESADGSPVLVRGRRRSRGLFDTFFTWGMGVIATVALRTPLHDVNAQPKIFPRDFFASWDDPPDDFSLDLYCLVMADRQRIKVVEQNVFFADRMHGEAKGGGTLKGKWKLIKRTFAYIMALRRRI